MGSGNSSQSIPDRARGLENLIQNLNSVREELIAVKASRQKTKMVSREEIKMALKDWLSRSKKS